MNFDIFFIGCLIVAQPIDVLAVLFSHRAANVTDRQQQLIKAADDDDYVVMDTVGLVEQYGYPIEEYTITSQDGYNIKIFRIFGSPESPPAEGKPVIYLQHGLFASSDYWVLIGMGYDLAFLLADNGYDVWIGNVRGNSYGKSHNNLTTDNKEFWDFSYHEIATLDLPAGIDHILNHTGQTDLTLIGHSMGSTLCYVILSEKPEYNKKVRFVITLAPIAFWNQQSLSLVNRLFIPCSDILRALNFLGIYEVMSQGKLTFPKGMCGAGSYLQFICIGMFELLFGEDPEEFNWDLLPYIGLYDPAGSSTKIMHHYEQNIKSGELRKFDYGRSDNVEIYGTEDPPLYNLSKITSPIAIIYGKGDAMAQTKNVEYLAKIIPSVVTLEAVPYDFFNHMDFQWANNAKGLLYDRIIELVSIFCNNSTNETFPAT